MRVIQTRVAVSNKSINREIYSILKVIFIKVEIKTKGKTMMISYYKRKEIETGRKVMKDWIRRKLRIQLIIRIRMQTLI